MDGGARQAQERCRRVRRQAEDGRANDRDRRAIAARAADPGYTDAADRYRRAVGRRDTDALVDVSLPAPCRAAYWRKIGCASPRLRRLRAGWRDGARRTKKSP